MKTLLVLVLSLCVASFAFANVDKAAIEEALAAYEAGLELTKAQDALVSQYGGGGNAIDNFGGPDAFGYTWQDSEEIGGPVYAWNDITATGTSVIGDMGDDVTAGPYPVGFNFPLYGITYSDFYIGSNGAINFDGGYVSFVNYEMPYTDHSGMIAWFWDDLDPADATDADVLYETMIVGDQTALVVSFLNWDEYAGAEDPDGQEDVTAQIILFEDGTIQIHYMSVESAEGLDIASCTIGIQDATSTIGLTALYNGSIVDYPYDGLAIEFSTDVVADASLDGYVYDNNTGLPIMDATVTVGTNVATTDEFGYYEFPSMYSNTFPWTVSAVGYVSQNGEVVIVPGANTLDFHLDIWDPTGDILVVDVDETIDSGPQIDAILTGLGYTTYYTNDFYEVPFTDYEYVFICLGMYPNDFNIDDGTPEETAVIDYLIAGGNLYVEGGDFLGWTPPLTLAGMFNIDAQADGSGDLANVIGEDFMAGADMPYVGENAYVDHIEPLDTAVRVFYNPADAAGCGIVDNGIEGYNYAVFSFEVGMLTDNEFTRVDIMTGVMEVLGGVEPDPVTLTLTPVVAVVAPGEDIVYDAHLVSTINTTIYNLRYQTFATTQGGFTIGPIDDIPFTHYPLMDYTATGMTVTVPLTAPAGFYTFEGIAGFPGNPALQVSDSFEVEVTGAAGMSGGSEWVGNGSFITGEDTEVVVLPTEFEMGTAYPNPFNPTTSVAIALPQASDLTVTVFNVMGQQVATLANGKYNAGHHNFVFDAANLASGLYFVQAQIPGELNAIQKITLMK